MPAAEVEVDVALVRHLVETQAPDLAGPVRIVANGWDNVVARLGDDLVVRVPRRAAAVDLIRTEARWLPILAPALRFPVPVPVVAGRPTEVFPWPWSIARWIDGRPLAPTAGGDPAVGADLARMHAALHRPAPADAPVNPFRGVALTEREDVFLGRLAALPPDDAAVLRTAFSDGIGAVPASGPPRWLHGDPHPGNVLVTTDGGRLAALIDFGDLAAGDPATDLALAWSGLGPAAREAYRSVLDPDPDAWLRGRAWAAVMASALAEQVAAHPEHAATVRHTIAQLRT